MASFLVLWIWGGNFSGTRGLGLSVVLVYGGGECGIIMGGSVAEWLKAHDSKSCGRDDRLGGSNPLASATKMTLRVFFVASATRPKGRTASAIFFGFCDRMEI